MEKPKILVLCGGKFAFPAIQMLGMDGNLCGVAIGKAEKTVDDFLSNEMTRNDIPFRSFKDKASLAALRSWIDEIKPDYIFSICFPFLLSADVLSYGEDRFFNFHTGPLPAYRGPMPIFEVIRYGEKETAISVHRMLDDFDNGPVILSEPVEIRKRETFGSLAEIMSERTQLVVQNMAQMLEYASVIPEQEQSESNARYFEFPEKEDTTIIWNRMPAEEILALIRACNPWNNGANAVISGESVKLISASFSSENHSVAPGTVLKSLSEAGLAVACLENKVINIHILSCDSGILTAEDYMQIKSKNNYSASY